MIEELQKRYTDANNINKHIMIIIKKHGLNKEIDKLINSPLKK